LHLGATKRVKDIDVPEHIQILHSPNTPIASIEVPRILKTATPSAAIEDEDLEEGEESDAETTDETSAAEETH